MNNRRVSWHYCAGWNVVALRPANSESSLDFTFHLLFMSSMNYCTSLSGVSPHAARICKPYRNPKLDLPREMRKMRRPNAELDNQDFFNEIFAARLGEPLTGSIQPT
jgi:hypothetical protein